jgi:hypothetical protein
MFTASPVGESSNPSSKVHQVFLFECALKNSGTFLPARQPKSGVRNKSFENSNYRFPKSLLGGEISVTNTLKAGESCCRSGILDQAREGR